MNGVLFRRSARSLWKTWVVFAAVLSLYVSMITAMFDPKLNATLDEIVTAMPQLMNMVGMQAGSSSLGGFLINYLYGFLLLLLPLVFSILAANRLVARWVDTGNLALGGFCFFASCLFNESRLSVALGAGVPVLFFLIRMLANMGGRLEKLKYATVFTLFDPTGLFRGDSAAYAGAAVLLALGLGFYALGTAVFSRRDLPL